MASNLKPRHSQVQNYSLLSKDRWQRFYLFSKDDDWVLGLLYFINCKIVIIVFNYT
jgi:hypothetical protein